MNFDQPNLHQLQVQARSAIAVFDYVDDTVFFVKDIQGQYAVVNETVVKRWGLTTKSEIIGKTAQEVFPNALGASYAEQDQRVLDSGIPLRGELELHFYPNRREGWCLTWKSPICTDTGSICGLAGISRDLSGNFDAESDLNQVAKALKFIKTNLSRNIQIEELAELSGLSAFQLDSRIRNLFGVSTGQFITQSRIEFASIKLKSSNEPIVHIARCSGYTDASAFTRQFRKMTGLTPTTYRNQFRIRHD